MSALMVAAIVVTVAFQPADAQTLSSSGAVTLNPASGTSATTFAIIPPVGADCPGSGEDGFRYHTYITPIATDPATLVFANGTPGPLPTQNLRTPPGAQLRNASPAIGNNFLAQQSASFQSGAFGATNLPPGDYWIGFACTSTGTPPVTVEFWATAITITAESGAGPNNFTYALAAPPATTTTTTTTTVAGSTTTTTTPTGASTTTTTTPAGGSTTTSTTVAGGSTTTSVPSGSTTTTTAGAPTTVFLGGSGGTFGGTTGGTGTFTSAGGTGTSSPSGTLAATGSSDTARLVFWGVLFVVFGRMAVLLGRTPRVVAPGDR
jgi:hypothetical protein